MSDEIRIYVADLAAYNNGILHGVWIDACEDVDDIQSAINAMLANSPCCGAEEYAIHDYEGFSGLTLSEYDGIEHVHELAEFIDEHNELGAAVLSQFCGDVEEATKAFEEYYQGVYPSLADYAQELTESTVADIPQTVAMYIDYERMGQDMAISDIFTIETAHDEVHVFWSH